MRERHKALQDVLEDLNDLIEHVATFKDQIPASNKDWQQEVSKYCLVIDIRHVADKFPKASPDLVERLGNANRDRRAKLSFLKARRELLAQHDDLLEGQRSASHAKSVEPSLFHDSGIGSSIQGRENALAFADQLQQRGEIEADNAEESDSDPLNPLTSYAKTIPESKDSPGLLTVPSPPKEFYENAPFPCSLCGKTLNKTFEHIAWKYVNLRRSSKLVSSTNNSQGATSSATYSHIRAHIHIVRSQTALIDAARTGKHTKSACISVHGIVLCATITVIFQIEKNSRSIYKNGIAMSF